MIDTRVPGDPAAVQALGLWVRHSLLAATADATSLALSARDRSVGEWDGEGAEAYRDHTSAVIGLSDAHCDRLAATADLVDAYAAHLADVQQHAAALRERAAAGGLHVDLTVVHAPDVAPMPTPVPPPGATPAGVAAHQRQVDAYGTYAARRALYDDVVAEFCGVLAHHATWVATYLTPRPEALEQETSGIGQVHAVLASTPAGLAVTGVLAASSFSLLRSLRPLSNELDLLRGFRRSGNPAVAALASSPYVTQRRTDVLQRIDRVEGLTRWLGPLGIGLELYSDVVAVSDGASPGRTAAQTGGSVLGGFYGAAAGTALVGTAAAAGLTAPAWVPVVVVGGAAVLGALALSEGWGTTWDNLPEGFTDGVDSFLSDAWEWATP